MLKRATDAAGNIREHETGRIFAPADVSFEHLFPVVKHWNRFGHNQKREQRYDWFNRWEDGNLVVLHKDENAKRGAALGITYRQDTGPNYT